MRQALLLGIIMLVVTVHYNRQIPPMKAAQITRQEVGKQTVILKQVHRNGTYEVYYLHNNTEGKLVIHDQTGAVMDK
jgi:hypothetical protein